MAFYLRKWSRRTKAFAVLAVACGALSFQMVHGYATELEALRPAVGDPVPVVVAATDLVRGAVLVDADLRVEQVPSAYAPPGALAVEDVVGRALVSDLAEGEPVTATRLAVSGGPVASLVPSGSRAFPIRADAPPGTVRPGDRVDVIATYGGPRPYSETVAVGLEVLTVGEGEVAPIGDGGGGSTSLVVLVSPTSAERLAYASTYAELSIAVAPPPPLTSPAPAA